MNKKELLIGLTIAAIVTYFMWPKTADKQKAPGIKQADSTKVDRIGNASIALTAFKKAKAAGESGEKLVELNQLLYSKYGMKVKVNDKGLMAVFDKDDKAVIYDKKA